MPTNSDLSNKLHPNAIKGILLFNQKKFFEAHEELEFAWRAEPGPIRDLYRGILQIGVAYYHLSNRNFSGAQKLIGRAMKWLKPYSGFYLGINIGKLKNDAIVILKKITQGDFDHIDSINTDLFNLIEIQLQKEK
jgi:predicted metal-dependent hydrolase